MAEQSIVGSKKGQIAGDSEGAVVNGQPRIDGIQPDDTPPQWDIDWTQFCSPFQPQGVVTPDDEIDRAQNPLQLGAQVQSLRCLFNPRSVAVIGATDKEGAVGRAVFANLQKDFKGQLYPVTPSKAEVLGVKAYASIADIQGKVDLAIIITAPERIPGIIEECGKKETPAAIIISAGFKEVGEHGVLLEQQVLAHAKKYGIRVLGPNCLGLQNPHVGLNATFASDMAIPGSVAFLSQSGALLTAELGQSLKAKFGLSALVSTGSMLDVNWADLIEYLGDDPSTRSIVMYMESIGEDAQSVLSAMKRVALKKPIIVIAPGATAEAAGAAKSHTGALAGADAVLSAALERCGVVRVRRIGELHAVAECLAKLTLPEGPCLTIITNAGGPGVLSVDSLVLNGGKLTALQGETIESLNSYLPPTWPHANPVDVIGDAPPKRYADALRVTMKDPNSNGILLILTPQDMTDPVGTAKEVVKVLQEAGDLKKPVFASFMGGHEMDEAKRILRAAGVAVSFPLPGCAH